MKLDYFFFYAEANIVCILILTAEALRQTAEKLRCPAFIGRYGGDEFTIFLQDPEGGDLPERVAGTLRSILEQKQRENRLPYDLQVSVGYDALRGKEDDMTACMHRADEKLYEDKRARNSGR